MHVAGGDIRGQAPYHGSYQGSHTAHCNWFSVVLVGRQDLLQTTEEDHERRNADTTRVEAGDPCNGGCGVSYC